MILDNTVFLEYPSIILTETTQGDGLFLRIEYSLKCNFKHSLNISVNSFFNA